MDEINKASFGVPKLLKPVIDIQNNANPLLSFLEMGAYSPFTRKLIEVGVPRETSITIKKLAEKAFGEKVINKEIDNDSISYIIKEIYSQLNYWEQAQVEALF